MQKKNNDQNRTHIREKYYFGIFGAILGAVATFSATLLTVYVKPTQDQKAILTAEAVRITANETRTVLSGESLIDPTLTPIDENTGISIKSMPIAVSDYEGVESNGLGVAWFSSIINKYGTEQYEFIYSIPKEDYGYAGLMFKFDVPKDMSEFNFVEIDVEFYENALINFYIIDDNENKNLVEIGQNLSTIGKDIEVSKLNGRQLIKIPLHSYFNEIQFDYVSQLEFFVDTSLTNGDSGLLINDIRFIE